MPLPAGFSEWEHLQDTVLRDHNKAVREYFKNQPDDDLTTPKSSLKHACIIKDDDTTGMTQMRMWLFEITIGHAQSVQRPVYGIPVSQVQADWKFRPQVKLYFLEKYDDETHGQQKIPQLEGEITFRLMHKTSETINRDEAEKLAKKIKSVFATPPFVWEKGWYKATYFEAEKGYDLRLLVKSRSEAERIVKNVLEIQEHSFHRDCFQFVEHDRSYPLNPGTHRVYGRTVKKPIKRRRADVKFRHAQLLIQGQPNAINLVATSGSRLSGINFNSVFCFDDRYNIWLDKAILKISNFVTITSTNQLTWHLLRSQFATIHSVAINSLANYTNYNSIININQTFNFNGVGNNANLFINRMNVASGTYHFYATK